MKATSHLAILSLALICILLRAESSLEQTPHLSLNLLTCLYNETNKKRADEYIFCLEKHRNHPMIEHIHVSYDTSHDSGKKGELHRYLEQCENVSISYIDGRQTFGDCIRLANELFPDQYVLLTNADIWFNDTLFKLKPHHLEKKLIALTRQHWPWNYSQDTWIFKTPFPEHPFMNKTYIGLLSCEKPIIYTAQKNDIHAYNPKRSIQCMHKHQSHVRNQTEVNRWGIIPLPFCTLEAAYKKAPPKKQPTKKKAESKSSS